jgi:PAS domain-containing protein
MGQKEVEMILLRQLASYLATPVFLVDSDGTVIFYNEAAEALIGRRFEEAGELPAVEWARMLSLADAEGRVLAPDRTPVSVALCDRQPAHGTLRIRALDGVSREISLTVVPLRGQAARNLGAVAFFEEKTGS